MSTRRPLLIVFLLLLVTLPSLLDAQRRRKQDEPSWPPERAYSRLFPGWCPTGRIRPSLRLLRLY